MGISQSLLMIKIEHYRQNMIALSEKHGIDSDLVLKSSERLDELINQYQVFLLPKNNS